MIVLKLVDVREDVVLAVSPKHFKSTDAAWAWLKKQATWKRGSLVVEGHGEGPAFHIHAVAFDGAGIFVTRWIFMERRTTTALVGPDGDALPGSEEITSRQMVWVKIPDASLAYAFAHGVTP